MKSQRASSRWSADRDTSHTSNSVSANQRPSDMSLCRAHPSQFPPMRGPLTLFNGPRHGLIGSLIEWSIASPHMTPLTKPLRRPPLTPISRESGASRGIAVLYNTQRVCDWYNIRAWQALKKIKPVASGVGVAWLMRVADDVRQKFWMVIGPLAGKRIRHRFGIISDNGFKLLD